jgi:hypothetical protein
MATARRLALVVGGGPAPGINGVISSVTIEAVNHGLEVIGFRDGFKNLVRGTGEPHRKLTIDPRHVADQPGQERGRHGPRPGSIPGHGRHRPGHDRRRRHGVLGL